MLKVEEYGAGQPLVLIHGSPGDARVWRGVGERLANRFRVLAPTLPGHYRPPQGEVPALETEEIAAQVEAALAELDAPAVLAGHSYGGNVALQIALRGKLALDRLVLLEPVPLKLLQMVGEDAVFEGARAAFERYAAAVRAGDPDAAAMVDFWFGPGGFAAMPESVQAYLRASAPVNLRDVSATFRERYTPDALRGIAIPVLVAVGTASPRVTGHIARAIAENVTDGRVAPVEAATHAIVTTHAAAVAALIDGFTPIQTAPPALPA